MIKTGRPFFKMSGSGNDFVFVDARSEPPGDEPDGEPGLLLGCEGKALRVGTGAASLRLLRVQEEGANEEDAASWFRRRRVAPGMRFDPVDEATARWTLGLGPTPSVAAKQGATA